jgi:hypothetical protein
VSVPDDPHDATSPAADHAPDAAQPRARADAARLRRLAEVFGTVLPDVTSDDAGDRRPGDTDSGLDDRWYDDNRPPHHDAS